MRWVMNVSSQPPLILNIIVKLTQNQEVLWLYKAIDNEILNNNN